MVTYKAIILEVQKDRISRETYANNNIVLNMMWAANLFQEGEVCLGYTFITLIVIFGFDPSFVLRSWIRCPPRSKIFFTSSGLPFSY